ncbi:alpha-glucosidase C-terminal domain-containing protein [Gracilibacillus sp. JCM 18860]|uniref:alpha-glucosidase C-terminal domain-containing protein n=1 Tax=Gracilibacillus sp. JCM 18860 TaxID=1306159 RepID=UPI00326152C9
MVYEKRTNTNRLIFVLNNEDKQQDIILDELANLSAKELFTNRQVTFQDQAKISVQAYGYFCFQL